MVVIWRQVMSSRCGSACTSSETHDQLATFPTPILRIPKLLQGIDSARFRELWPCLASDGLRAIPTEAASELRGLQKPNLFL